MNRSTIRVLFFLCGYTVSFPHLSHAESSYEGDLEYLFNERVRSVVVVEFFIQREIDRRPMEAIGLSIDRAGSILLLDSSLPLWVPVEDFRDFRVFIPGHDEEPATAKYLGRNPVTKWHYIRAATDVREHLVPVTDYACGGVKLGQPLWGIGVLPKKFDFEPYVLDGRLALVQHLPLGYGLSERLLGSPGGPVFDFQGRFVGWIANPSTRERVLFMGNDQYKVGLLPIRESGTFLLADDFFHDLENRPEDPWGGDVPWIGVSGMQPIDREVAGFFGLENQGALVLSTILENSPAAKGGLVGKDVVVALNGEALPKFRPDTVVQRFFERKILLSKPGELMRLTVIRGEEWKDIDIQVGVHPKRLHEAPRQYLADLGVTVREFVVWDAIQQRVHHGDATGVIAHFVRPNSPVNTAGLRRGDWIKEIDGQIVVGYDTAVSLLSGIEADETRDDFVLLIDRNNETSVLRVKLN